MLHSLLNLDEEIESLGRTLEGALGLAEIYLQLGRLEEVKKEYIKVLSWEPKNIPVLLKLAKVELI